MGNIIDTKYVSQLPDDSSESESDTDCREEFKNRQQEKGANENHSLGALSMPNLQDIQTDFTNEQQKSLQLDQSNYAEAVINLGSEIDLTVDAAKKSTGNFPRPEQVLNLEKVLDIEKRLDTYEVVSLVYLLYDDPQYALQELVMWLTNRQKKLLYGWVENQQNMKGTWEKKLIEALCIIKNYEILKSLGYNKNDLICFYLPHHGRSSTHINKIRKAIYVVCENLNPSKTEKFIDHVRSRFMEKKISFTNEYDLQYLELYFLKWEMMQFIKPTNLEDIKFVLKIMNEEALYDMINEVTHTETKTFMKEIPSTQTTGRSSMALDIKKQAKTRKTSTSVDNTLHSSHPQSTKDFESYRNYPGIIGQDQVNPTRDSHDDNFRYKIDVDKPGVVLIINQETFYTEINPEYQHLLPKDTKYILETRMGTQKDRDDLSNVFLEFGFDHIIVQNNLSHLDMLKKIREVVSNIRDESSLFVCILSHGDKGVVYGSNSCRVQVSEIQDIMCTANKKYLIEKPKVLILQSCQGVQCQKKNESSDEEDENDESLTTDGQGTSRRTVPKTADILTFWATIPGYAAIRNKKTGSWFIQSLCTKMRQLGHKCHFADICTRIKYEVTGKTWTVENCDIKVMTPLVETTLTKDFYLPPMKNSSGI